MAAPDARTMSRKGSARSPRGRFASIVAVGLVGLVASIASALQAHGWLPSLWEPLPVVDASGWVVPALPPQVPGVDVLGFAVVVVFAALRRSQGLPRRTKAVGLAAASFATAVSAVARFGAHYVTVGRPSALFVVVTCAAIALLPLAGVEVAETVAPARLAEARRDAGDGLDNVAGVGGILLGLWLLGIPLASAPRAALHAHLVGGVVVAVAALSLAPMMRPARWVNAAIGAALFLAPLIAGYRLLGTLHLLVTGLLLLTVSVAFAEPRATRRSLA